MTTGRESVQIAVELDGVRMRCHISRHNTCYDVIRGITSSDKTFYAMFERRNGTEKMLQQETREHVYKRVRSRIDSNVTNFVLRKITKLASKRASIAKRRGSYKFDAERGEGSSLNNNLNNDKPLIKCYIKHISSVYRVLPMMCYKISLLFRTRADGADDINGFELLEYKPRDGIEAASTNTLCDIDVAFLSDEGCVLGFYVSEIDSCIIDDVNVTSQVDSAFEGEDTMSDLEKNVFDDDHVSMATLIRLRSMFNDGGNVGDIVNDSAMDSFMRD